jgi:hypothetical protein
MKTDAVMCDGGCNINMFNREDWFDDLKPLSNSVKVGNCSNQQKKITMGGTVRLPVKKSDGTVSRIVIKNAIYNPDCPCNLVAPGWLKREYNIVHDGHTDHLVYKNTDEEVAQLHWENDHPWFTVATDLLPKPEAFLSVDRVEKTCDSQGFNMKPMGHGGYDYAFHTRKAKKDVYFQPTPTTIPNEEEPHEEGPSEDELLQRQLMETSLECEEPDLNPQYNKDYSPGSISLSTPAKLATSEHPSPFRQPTPSPPPSSQPHQAQQAQEPRRSTRERITEAEGNYADIAKGKAKYHFEYDPKSFLATHFAEDEFNTEPTHTAMTATTEMTAITTPKRCPKSYKEARRSSTGQSGNQSSRNNSTAYPQEN